MATPQKLYLGNDYTVTLATLTGGGSALTSATVTWSVLNAAGTVVGTGTLSHTSGGTYTGTMESSSFSSLSAGDYGFLRVVAVQGGFDGEWRKAFVADYRPFTGG